MKCNTDRLDKRAGCWFPVQQKAQSTQLGTGNMPLHKEYVKRKKYAAKNIILLQVNLQSCLNFIPTVVSQHLGYANWEHPKKDTH